MLRMWLQIKRAILEHMTGRAYRRFVNLRDKLLLTQIELGEVAVVHNVKKPSTPDIQEAQLVPDTRLWN